MLTSPTIPSNQIDLPQPQRPAPTPRADFSDAAPAPATADKSPGLTFHDLLDVINPLQHLPIISTIYRAITGDGISAAARIAGDTLFGGVYGFVSGVVNAVVQGETGKDVGGHVMAFLGLDSAGKEIGDKVMAFLGLDSAGAAPATQLASAKPWIDPDSLPTQDAVLAPPWVDPDSLPAKDAVLAKPWIDPDRQPQSAAVQTPVRPAIDPDRAAAANWPVIAPPWIDPDKLQQTAAAATKSPSDQAAKPTSSDTAAAAVPAVIAKPAFFPLGKSLRPLPVRAPAWNAVAAQAASTKINAQSFGAGTLPAAMPAVATGSYDSALELSRQLKSFYQPNQLH